MWRTPLGDRVLGPEEWAAFRIGLAALVDALGRELLDDPPGGGGVYERLTAPQKWALLADVAQAALDPTVPAPRSAAGEGAVAAVFEALTHRVAAEAEFSTDGCAVRRAVLSAVQAVRAVGRSGENLPVENGRDREGWVALTVILAGAVLEKRPNVDAERLLDMDPAVAGPLKQQLGLPIDYFAAAPPDPHWRATYRAQQVLARLLDRPAPNDEGVFPALWDMFHDVHVGPLPAEGSGPWEANPWMMWVGMLRPEWDCPYEWWQERVSGDLPAAFAPAAAAADEEADLPPKHDLEWTPAGWVVRDHIGSFWAGGAANEWVFEVAPESDDEQPALLFDDADAARRAFLAAERVYAGRQGRRQAVLARLKARPGGEG